MQLTRKDFFIGSVAATAAIGLKAAEPKPLSNIQGFDEAFTDEKVGGPWQPFSDKKVRVGIAGYGVCKFGAMFFFQNHPNVEVVAATDLFKDRCAELAKAVGAKRTYTSAQAMIDQEGKNMDAVFIGGYHACSAVPTLWGEEQLDRAPRLIEAVKKTGLVYALFETTAFRPQCVAMRRIYEAGGFGMLAYTEGEYFHLKDPQHPIGSYKDWRVASPPQYYATHSNGFYTCMTHKTFTEVTCVGTPGTLPEYSKNRYGNPFASEVAFYRTEDGGTARMTRAANLPGYSAEAGRCFGTKGCFRNDRYFGDKSLIKGVDLLRTGLPPGMKNNGHHGGSHPYLTDDFLRAILVPGYKVCVDAATALNTTVTGVYAHLSAMKGGETLKIPVFSC